jgi:hypothetical protein
MDSMNLKCISTNVLNDYDRNKYYGYLVYLREKYNGYKKGLYLGGEDGWERLTNDSMTFEPISYVDVPIASTETYYYEADLITYLPFNWSDISEYCYLTNNRKVDVGEYTVSVYLKDDSWEWSDMTNNIKTLTFKILQRKITEANVILSSYKINYGDDLPTVKSVEYNDRILTEDTDYTVSYDSDKNASDNPKYVTINFINNYTGSVKKSYYIQQVTVNKPVFENEYNFVYDSNSHSVYPTNWDDIKSYCKITNYENTDAGTYTLTISLNSSNYCWSDGTSKSITQSYSISKQIVDVPVWNSEYYKTYDGKSYSVYPTNWDDIKSYCTVTDNVETNVGEYTTSISLNSDNYIWSDNTNVTKTQDYQIDYIYVTLPVWSESDIFTYTGKEITYKPSNWDDISAYVVMTNYKGIDAGTYTVKLSLRDSVNCRWSNKKVTDQTREFYITQADGYFINGPWLNGDVIVNSKLTCTATFIDSSSEIKYEWYRSDDGTLESGIHLQTDEINNYTITPDDYGYYIICNVVPSATTNYTSTSSFVKTQNKVSKILKESYLEFEDDTTEVSLTPDSTQFTIPTLKNISTDDGSKVVYTVVSGNGEMSDTEEGVVNITGTGDIVVNVSIEGSTVYNYVPNSITYTIHVISDTVYYGMYDKTGSPNEKEVLYSGSIPDNYVEVSVSDTVTFDIKRSDFPTTKEDGSDQKYFGWYILVPTTKTLYSLLENGNALVSIESNQLKNDDSSELIITKDGVDYRVYGKFNIGKTADTWFMTVTIK